MLQGTKGALSILEVLVGGTLTIISSVALMSLFTQFAESQRRLATKTEARNEVDFILHQVKKAYGSRYLPPPAPPLPAPAPLPEYEFSPIFPPAAAFGDCDFPTPCQSILIRQNNTWLNTLQSVSYESTCEAIGPEEPIDYANIPPLPGGYTCPLNTERPIIRVRKRTDINDAATETVTTFPRGAKGAFLCARQCNNAISVQASIIYFSSQRNMFVETQRISIPIDWVDTTVETLPP